MYRVRNNYSTKHLFLFYNSYAKLTIRYGTLSDRRAGKTNLESTGKCQKRKIRTIFFKMNIKSVSNIFFALKIGTVFKKYMSEKIEEVFNQPFSNSSLAYLKNIDNNCMYETRRKTNGLITTIFSRTVLKLNHQRTLCVNSLTGY